MTNEQSQVKNWMSSFGQETPDKPCIPSLEVRKRMAKLIFEEALETISALGLIAHFSGKHSDQWLEAYSFSGREEFVNSFPEDHIINQPIDLTLIADGCEDLKVVTEGCLVGCGLVDQRKSGLDPSTNEFKLITRNQDPLFNEVMRSNFSKMWKYEDLHGFGSIMLAWNTRTSMLLHRDGLTYSGTMISGRTVQEGRWIVKDLEGKVIKSPSYSPANLQPLIEEMMK